MKTTGTKYRGLSKDDVAIIIRDARLQVVGPGAGFKPDYFRFKKSWGGLPLDDS